MSLTLYNTLTRRKEAFEPLDSERVRLYACGPTVYDYAHIGNARPVIVFDQLFRLLRHIYGADQVIYVRNITDVDDKINARAASEGRPISEITAETTRQFHDDIAALGVLPPTVEPRATGHIEEMKVLIERLVSLGHAYVAEDHVLFHVPSMPDYGRLSRRTTDEMEAGARVEVAPYKKDPMDFVLWKPSKEGEPAWDSPCDIATPGRPGWHIECSAMSAAHLGETFDIHGGGIDLVFPHHENEIAQSTCGHGTEIMAKVWMHNGYLQVEGDKMSKSLGNFITIHELLTGWKGYRWPGAVIRYAMLSTHYRQPIDWTVRKLQESAIELVSFKTSAFEDDCAEPSKEIVAALEDDLNTPRAIAELRRLLKAARQSVPSEYSDGQSPHEILRASCEFLGIDLTQNFSAQEMAVDKIDVDEAAVERLIAARTAAREGRDWAQADSIRDELAAMGVALKDGPEGTSWEISR